MVRKIICLCVIVLMLVNCIAIQALAATHTVYDSSTISSTYLTYFRDILSGTPLNSNYVAFCNAQNSYIMVVGDLEYNNGTISLNGGGKSYTFSRTDGNYNNQYRYYVNDINNFSVNVGNNIIYSDVGEFPQLIERGAKYEILTTIIICIALFAAVISRIFYKR